MSTDFYYDVNLGNLSEVEKSLGHTLSSDDIHITCKCVLVKIEKNPNGDSIGTYKACPAHTEELKAELGKRNNFISVGASRDPSKEYMMISPGEGELACIKCPVDCECHKDIYVPQVLRADTPCLFCECWQ